MKNFKKLSALFLALVMIVGLIPINAFASNSVLRGSETEKTEVINIKDEKFENEDESKIEDLRSVSNNIDIPNYDNIDIINGDDVDVVNPKTEKYILDSKKFDFSNFTPKGDYSKSKYKDIIEEMFSKTPLVCVGTHFGKYLSGHFHPYQLENWYYRTKDGKVAYCLNLGKAEPKENEMSYSPDKEKLNNKILNIVKNGYPSKYMFEGEKDRNDLFEYITAVAVKIAQGKAYGAGKIINKEEYDGKEHEVNGLTEEMLDKMDNFDPSTNKFIGEEEEPYLAIAPIYLSQVGYKKAFENLIKEDQDALTNRNKFIKTKIKELLAHKNDDPSTIVENFEGKNSLTLGEISGPYKINLSIDKALDEIIFNIEEKNDDIKLTFLDKNKKEIQQDKIKNGEEFFIKAEYLKEGKINKNETIKLLAYTKNKNILTDVFYSPKEDTTNEKGLKVQDMYVAETIGLTIRKIIKVNEEPTFNVLIFKYEENSNPKKAIKGAKIKIFEDKNLEKEIVELESDNFGKFTASLKAGTYYYKESFAPVGYIKDNSIHELTIEKTDNNLGFIVKGNEFTNKKESETPPDPTKPKEEKIEVAFGKYDIADGSKIVEGAKLEILKYNENSKEYDILVKTIITDKEYAKDFKILLEPGKYLFKETVAPNGYVLSKDECKFEVKYKEDGKTLEIVDSEGSRKIGNKPSSVIIEKIDAFTKKAINGVKFDLYKDGNLSKKDLVTHIDGKIKLNYLQHGKYKIIETYTPDGYILDKTEKEFTVDNNGNVSVEKITIENTPITDKITKVDKETGKALPGVKFQFFNSDKTSFEKITDQNGQIDLSGLAVGEYTFIELKALDGYEKSTNLYKVNILPNGSLVGDIRIENKPIVYDFTLTKVNNKNEKLYGAKFEIRDSKDNLVKTVETDANGLAAVKGLVPDTYSVIEIEAPKGYIRSEKIYKVTIDKDGIVTGNTVITNEDTFVELIKENEKGEKLADAEFEIKDINNKLLAKAKTNRDGKITIRRLPAGNKYYVKEIKAPKGYLLDTKDYEFEISENGKVTGTTTFINKKSEIILKKMSKDTRDYLEGAKFKLKDSHDKTIKDVESDRRGEIIIEGLEPGDYYLEEYEAPEGYLINEKAFKFTVTQDGKLKGDDIIYNEEAKFTLVKKDLTTGAVLEGASFTIKDKNDKIVARITTNRNGEAEVLGLGEGRYSLEEIVAPQGYSRATKAVSFSVDKNGKIDGKDILEVFNKQEPKKVTPTPANDGNITSNIPNDHINNETKIYDESNKDIVTPPVEEKHIPIEESVQTGDETSSNKGGWVLLIIMLILAVVVCILYFLSKNKENNKKLKNK